ncbi:DNA-binding protein [Blastococcus sp. CT_GayMR20]|uniref:helix-turn-helix domain-containing protein n=1 Tax=Blastococcus sp. CT_GayMR20 TaxID=2559609 RepID=UPI0010738379|nr:helix-turn-helix domain-containing protein [Blastococcus sp. CT_GayMR20]TFV90112.1 DNA-binding protein [Blastococcus sp. CT_GayMR20]
MDLQELRVSRTAVVTVAQAAEVLGIDVRTVSRAIENGELPALRLGRRVLVPRLPLLAALGVRVEAALTEVDGVSSGDR